MTITTVYTENLTVPVRTLGQFKDGAVNAARHPSEFYNACSERPAECLGQVLGGVAFGGVAAEIGPATSSVEVAAASDVAATEAIEAGTSEVAVATEAANLPTLEIDGTKMPNIGRNIESAQQAGQPSVLARETDPAIINANRSAACAGFCGPGSPDEYPFASTTQGGAGAQVNGVPLAEQRIQGGVMSQFYQKNGIGQGDQFRVVVRW
ncbi:MAG: NucA/NucB deoxyribonuclease domain-containing protein [Ilumatobacteraceae bacterium]